MAWFRANRGVAAWLALFALACQLVFSFGHIHLGKYVVSSFGGGKFGISVAAPAAVPAVDKTSDAPPLPQQNPAGAADDFCAICANISLAGALILPVLAFILAPALFTRVFRWSVGVGAPVSVRHRPFSARGPPHA